VQEWCSDVDVFEPGAELSICEGVEDVQDDGADEGVDGGVNNGLDG
jgi:hypothetical protein